MSAQSGNESLTNRSEKLLKYFELTLRGKRDLKSVADGSRFIEAFCDIKDTSKAVESVIAADKGLEACAKAIRLSLDITFLTGPATDLLLCLSDPSLKQLASGHFLLLILEAIVEPPSFWTAFVDAYEKRMLSDRGVQAFGWLLLELLCSYSQEFLDVRPVAEKVTAESSLLEFPAIEVRILGQRIKHVLNTTSTDLTQAAGGRHDNDFVNFRDVKIIPTTDEFASAEQPFYRTAAMVASTDIDARGSTHLDNQFRLLRESLVHELRNGYQNVTGKKKGARKSFTTPQLSIHGIDCGPDTRRRSCCLTLECQEDFAQLSKLEETQERLKYIRDNPSFVKHRSFGCLISDGLVLAFATVERDNALLSRTPPIIALHIEDEAAFSRVLIVGKTTSQLIFAQVDIAVFAYEPILKCLQNISELPLKEQIIDLQPGSSRIQADILPDQVIDSIREHVHGDLSQVVVTPETIKLDKPQADSLLNGLLNKASLIHGPPGTGKSFLGALIAKLIHDHTEETILLLSYKNHALDQFLEDLLDIGITADSMVRLGSKGTTRTEALKLTNQPKTYKHDRCMWRAIDDLKACAEGYYEILASRFSRFLRMQASRKDVLDYLEFSEDSEFYDAFNVPEQPDDMLLVGSGGRAVDKYYLIDRWVAGKDAGLFQDKILQDHSHVWKVDNARRKSLYKEWTKMVLQEEIAGISTVFAKYNKCQERLAKLFRERDIHTLRGKRIIACTTTGAAMYTEALRNIAPGVILVEEAGEILESHILAAMSPQTKQLVLIGDHKQLRPKIDSYKLSVEKGDGYDLNMSLFERLVISGYPCSVLSTQHRMRPEISSLVRQLMYPELEDSPKTQNRPPLCGLQNNVIFIAHTHRELGSNMIADRRDEDAKSSFQNVYEAEMVLKCVRYLGQQGYKAKQLVVLTPYLAQLSLLRERLAKENDLVLNDLDSWELIQAGVMPSQSSGIPKNLLRISSIDNYQGEESDVVIASLTRSNPDGEIGFMAYAQRVNVLLSRARNGLILIGNAETFVRSKKGKPVWEPLVEQLKREGNFYDGFPVKCERHPDKKATLRAPEDFDTICPDGGCSERCGAMLNCGLHQCPQYCHKLDDHSKVLCMELITSKCPQSHINTRPCHDSSQSSCRKCDAEARKKEKQKKRDFKLQQEREAKQDAYAKELAQLQAEIDHEKKLMKNEADAQERQKILAQHRQDLERIKKTRQQKVINQATSSSATNNTRGGSTRKSENGPTGPTSPHSSSPSLKSGQSESEESESEDDQGSQSKTPSRQSEARDDWDYQKLMEGQDNEALDTLIGMIGLESVKQKFLDIKAKVDVMVRQGVSLEKERFGAALLGNPGTGKTTVARLYAKFLCKVGALPGEEFVETSGSGLANDGINACKKLIDGILNNGGGVFFIDEAYQLVSGNSAGGKAVLDYLLAEIENLTGKVVFVLAGYNKQMEGFFAHNPGIPSRIPIEMTFEDYTDEELLLIMQYTINHLYRGSMKIEGGMLGLYSRILARRIGRGRGKEGFGNAREVQNRVSIVTERQAKRLKKERRTGAKTNDNLLTKVDMIGPEPAVALKNNESWAKLRTMIGLGEVKQSLKALLDTLQFNYQRELEEKPIVEYSLNKCFVGSPGTGKTIVAKLYGKVLSDLGMLSNGEVVIKNPADFIGEFIGKSEALTKGILASTVGKVLIIDEAYMLRPTKSGSGDSFKTSVVDTIVAEVQSTAGEDRCVLLLGYRDEMEEMLRDVNPGMARRFPLDSAFIFEDYNDKELEEILDLKLKEQGFNVTPRAKQVAMDVLGRARNRPNFGNGGEINIMLDKAKLLHQKNLSQGKTKLKDTLEPFDIDPDFDRGAMARTNIQMLFKGVIGCETIVRQLQEYQATVENMKSLGMDPRGQIPFTFLFTGPPGTGKTSTAQRMGKVYFDMGFLASAEVIDCSATDLVGQYVGHTGPKVQKLLQKALGKILFIDEAYRLADGHFAVEAMDELVDSLTKPKYANKLICILAGYNHEMNQLMFVNPGLTSRFPQTLKFRPLTDEECLNLLIQLLQAREVPVDVSVLLGASNTLRVPLLRKLNLLMAMKSWGNARDVQTIEKDIFKQAISSAVPPISSLVISESMIFKAIEDMLVERRERNNTAGTRRHNRNHGIPQMNGSNPTPNAPNSQSGSNSNSNKNTNPDSRPSTPPTPSTPPRSEPDTVNPAPTSPSAESRDVGVSDETWEQLQQDKKEAEDQEREHQRLEQERQEREQEELERQKELERIRKAEQDARDEEERQRLEAERLQRELEMRKRQDMLKQMEQERQRREQEKEWERKAQEKLRIMGVCCQGFHWIKQAYGYRCAGGGHFVSDQQLNMS